jgi:hypothetical protein
MSRSLGTLIAIGLSLFLVGCGDDVTGTYSSDMGGMGSMTVELKSGGKATVSMAGGGQTEKKDGTYTVSGDTVTIMIPGQKDAATFTKQKDGSLAAQGGMTGLTLKKK